MNRTRWTAAVAAVALPLSMAAAAAPTAQATSPPRGSLPQGPRDGARRLAAQATSSPRGVSGGSLPQANTPLPLPRHHGTLRITGQLRDGGTVAAAGLSWRPPALPRGDRLLSFEIGYTWQACAHGKCVTAADTTAAPFAARRYVAGHADAGQRLKLTETATAVVETAPATFTFRTASASVSRTASSAVRAYPAGRRPATEFVNGTPERRTGSSAEFFSVDPPHYSAADGPVSQRYRVDRGRWHTLPASHVFYTGTLAVGRHRVAVRTEDKAGATTARFGWRVVPLPAPLPCQGHCWYPPHLDASHHPMRWDWQIGRVTPLERTGGRAVDIYDIDGFLTTRAEVHTVRTAWQAATLRHPKTICYLDLAWEDYRPDATPGRYFPAAALGNVYFGFPQERWLDFRQLGALKPMLGERIRMCAAKGFDAVELDDIDSFDPPGTTGFHLTPGDAQNFLAYAFNEIHRYGMTGLWKNSPLLSWWGRRYADGAVVEECYTFHQCFAAQLRGSSQYGITCSALRGHTPCGWDGFSTDATARQPTGKWVGEAEYGADHFVCNPGQNCPPRRRFATFCHLVYAPSYGFSAVKFDVDLNGNTFYPCPKGS